jgi:hypothetical protein
MSSVLTSRSKTVVDAAVKVLAKIGRPAGPETIVDQAISQGLAKIPSRRTKSYVVQIFQSTLYNNAFYAKKSSVKRTTRGKYTTRKTSRKGS